MFIKILPQIIYLALQMIGLGLDISRHGKERTVKENAWITVISILIITALLAWGGWYDVLK